MNRKSIAWDFIGGDFWEQGRASARPSDAEIDLFSKNIKPTDTCCVIGASTKHLIERVLKEECRLTVYDFSDRMCSDLRCVLQSSLVNIEKLDICADTPHELFNKMDIILNDRLINRFSSTEIKKFLISCYKMLKPGGILRSSIKIGFYDMDKKLINASKKRDDLDDIYNPETTTIDYEKSIPFLNDCIMPHGTISKEQLYSWYSNRGKEKRFLKGSFELFFNNIFTKNKFKIVESIELPDAPNTILFTIKKLY